MLYQKIHHFLILGIIGFGFTCFAESAQSAKETPKCCGDSPFENMDVYDISANHIVGNSAKFEKLRAEKIKTQSLASDLTITNTLITKNGKFENILSDKVITNSLETGQANIFHVLADTIITDTLCAQNGCIKQLFSDLVITTTIQADDYLTSLKAFATNSTDFTDYVLGTDINLDTIIDDDNGNITQNPTTYTAPRSGYYAITIVAKTINVNTGTPDTINGPLAEHIDIYVNGVSQAQTFNEFNRIRNLARIKTTSLTSLLHLNKGDQVTFRYFAVHENLATGQYIDTDGTATLMGSLQDNATWMMIHYLSSDL